MATIPKPYSVSEITRMIKTALEESFFDIWVEGEISNYVHHSSGHRYLQLKDANAVIKVTIWRTYGSYLKFEPENGQKVLVNGNISVYEKGGNYQLNCKKMLPVGVGELELAFRQLHEKLSREGLFDEALKKDLPAYPNKIGIVTSPTGAAVRDIIRISKRRNDAVQLVLYPAQVQGDGAEKTIAEGIAYFNTRDDIDVIIIGRGGGSLEDLWPFNTETTVRAVAASKIPVVSAVGHEIDITLSDLAADARASTPSAAAEIVVWSRQELQDYLDDTLYNQAYRLQNLLERARERLTAVLKSPSFLRPMDIIHQRQQYLDNITRLLTAAGKKCFDVSKNRLSLALSRLDTLSPLKILSRGYSVSRRHDSQQLVRSVMDIAVDENLETILSDGQLVSKVVSFKKGKLKKGGD